jgi:hypothetical protein
VNGSDASISGNGEFEAKVFLSVGLNKIKLVATDIHQNSGELDFTIVREGMVISKNELLNGDGIYYALIIGVSDYQSL